MTRIEPGQYRLVTMHDGSRVGLRRVDESYDPTDRIAAISYIEKYRAEGAVVTGLLYLEESSEDMHTTLGSTDQALSDIPYDKLNPGAEALKQIQGRWR